MVKKSKTTRPRRTGSFELMWQAPVRRTRGPRAQLSADAIVQAAIAMADAQGLEGLTMAALAKKLHAAPMALYRHVPGKTELIELMSERAFGPPPPLQGPWRDAIADWARANLARLVERPWLIEAVSRRRAIGPNLMAWLDAALAALARSGLPEQNLIEAVLLVDGHARSTAQLLTGAPASPEWAINFGRALEAARGGPSHATLTRLAESGRLAPAGDPMAFEFGLQRILDGIELFIKHGGQQAGERHGRSRPARSARRSR